MLTLYHRTTVEAAEAILRAGALDGPTACASTRPNGHPTGFGEAIIELRVPEDAAELDDEFPDGEQHYRVPLDSMIFDAYTLSPDGRCQVIR